MLTGGLTGRLASRRLRCTWPSAVIIKRAVPSLDVVRATDHIKSVFFFGSSHSVNTVV